MSTTTSWFLLSVYNHNISITVKRNWTWCIEGSKLDQKTLRFTEICKIPPDPNLRGILLYGFLFLSVCFRMACSKWESRCFHTAVQGCQYCNTAAQNPSVLADHSSALAYPRHNISALQLISVHSRIIRDVLLFLCCIRRASWPVQESQCSSSQPKLLSISPLSLSIHIHSK